MEIFARQPVEPVEHRPGHVTVHASYADAEDKHNTPNPREDS
jgi:hypothetical protein